MESIDERIRKALSSEDRAFLEQMDSNGSLYSDVAETFRGHTRWLNTLGWVFGFVLFAVAAYCGWQFFTQPDMRTMQLWGAGVMLSALGLGLIKLYFFMEIQKNAIVREIKRVELQVAGLTAALRGAKPDSSSAGH
jgi:hypothetical protein